MVLLVTCHPPRLTACGMAMRRVVLTSLAALAISLAAEGAAYGCVCVTPPEKPTPEEERASLVWHINTAFAVFTGEVVELDTNKVKFRVDKIWKGSFGDEIVMETGAIDMGGGVLTSSSCAYWFKRGEKYLVFAYGDTAAEMQAYSCTRTSHLARAGQEIKNLDEVSPHEKRNRKPEDRN